MPVYRPPTGYAPGGVTYRPLPLPKKKAPVVRRPPTTAGRPVPVNPWAATSQEDIDAQATSRANSALLPERQMIERQRALAAARSLADQSAIMGLGQAAGQMLQGIGPAMQQGYQQAAGEIGGLAQGFSGELAGRMAQGAGANADFAQAQGQVAGQGPDPTAMKDVSYGLGGFIPGTSFEEQGAAAGAWGAQQKGVTALQMRDDLERALAQGKIDDQQFESQLVELAGKFPELRDAALDSLWKREIDKLGARLDIGKQAEDTRHTKVQEGLDRRQVKVQEQAQTLYGKQFGETVAHNKAGEAHARAGEAQGWESLRIQDTKQKAAVRAAAAAGRMPDASLSKVYGHVVDSHGHAITDAKGNQIKVKSTAKGKAAAQKDVYGRAVDQALDLLGNPIDAAADPLNPNRGKYAKRGGGYTNDPKKAKRDSKMTFNQAQAYLMSRFGLSRARARAALIAATWKPPAPRGTPGLRIGAGPGERPN